MKEKEVEGDIFRFIGKSSYCNLVISFLSEARMVVCYAAYKYYIYSENPRNEQGQIENVRGTLNQMIASFPLNHAHPRAILFKI